MLLARGWFYSLLVCSSYSTWARFFLPNELQAHRSKLLIIFWCDLIIIHGPVQARNWCTVAYWKYTETNACYQACCKLPTVMCVVLEVLWTGFFHLPFLHFDFRAPLVSGRWKEKTWVRRWRDVGVTGSSLWEMRRHGMWYTEPTK